MNIKSLVVSSFCGALLSGVAVWACDKETPKSATGPCNSNQVCANLVPVEDDGEYICGNAHFVNDIKKWCKSHEEDTNCGEDTVNCSKVTSCKAEFVLETGKWVCVPDTQSGEWTTALAKVEDACQEGHVLSFAESRGAKSGEG